jgi:hypothetical protein
MPPQRGRKVPKANADKHLFLSKLEQQRAPAGDTAEQLATLQRVKRFLRRPDLACYNCAMSIFSQKVGISPYFSSMFEGEPDVHWSISKAAALIAQGELTPFVLPEEHVWNLLHDHDISVGHIEHIPQEYLREPGIIAMTGNPVIPYILIDGNHRAARALLEQRPFSVYVLDLQLSAKAMLDEKEFEDIHAMIVHFLRS